MVFLLFRIKFVMPPKRHSVSITLYKCNIRSVEFISIIRGVFIVAKNVGSVKLLTNRFHLFVFKWLKDDSSLNVSPHHLLSHRLSLIL